MSENPKHVTVRLRVPPELRDKIAESASSHNRSMNADMVARLEKSFDDDGKQIMLLEKESMQVMEDVVSKLISNAVKTLISQGVSETVIKDAFDIGQ